MSARRDKHGEAYIIPKIVMKTKLAKLKGGEVTNGN